MKIGLYFGSFNPIHIGHLITAEHFRTYSDIDYVWFVVSPQNPLKDKKTLASEMDRFKMVEQAITSNEFFKTCNIEFNMKKPSYTVNTLRKLQKEHLTHEFIILMGMDCVNDLPKWKDYEYILNNYQIYVNSRGNEKFTPKLEKFNIVKYDFHNISISSSIIRDMIKSGKSIKYLVSDDVIKYIKKRRLYI